MERFWTKVNKTSECWVWTASTTKGGYGRFKYLGKMAFAHRVAWVLVYGEIPEGIQVLHSCDNPPCVNINHLFLGTHADNMQDRNQKGRASGGNNTGRIYSKKLSELEANEVRRLRSEGITCIKIAALFRVSKSTISNIELYRGAWDDGRDSDF